MPITPEELIQDLPEALALFESAKSAIAGLPPVGQRKVADFAKALGLAENTPGYLLAVLIDTLEAQSKT